MKRIVFSLGIIVFVVIGLIVVRFGSALFQEGNPLPILTSILKLELTEDDYKQFSESDQSRRYVSGGNGSSSYDVINEYMGKMGWSFKEQLGAGLVFSKNKEQLVVETRQYTKHYFIWNIPKEVFN